MNTEFARLFETIKTDVADSSIGGAAGAEEKKDNKGPVTVADYLISFGTALLIDRSFPSDHFVSEEEFDDAAIANLQQLLAGDSDLEARYTSLVNDFVDLRRRRPQMFKIDPDKRTWVIDPIDGTVNFIAGNPNHAASLARLAPDPADGLFKAIAGCVVTDRNHEISINGETHQGCLVQFEDGKVSIHARGADEEWGCIAADFKAPKAGPSRICLRDSNSDGPNKLRPKLEPDYLETVEVESKWASSVTGLLEVLVGGQFSGYAGYMNVWDFCLIAPAIQAATGRKETIRRLSDGSVMEGFTVDDLARAKRKAEGGLSISGAIGDVHVKAFAKALSPVAEA